MTIDLTPFGFTPTENRAYGALLDLGPSSGYGLAKALSIARANAYQALNGLASKGAAVRTDDQPQRYRAVRPDAVLTLVVGRQAERVDVLEQQVRELGRQTGETFIPLGSRRALVDTAMRTIARDDGALRCVSPIGVARDLGPAWRRRQAQTWPTAVWVWGGGGGGGGVTDDVELAIPVDRLAPDRAASYWDRDVFLLAVGDVGMACGVRGSEGNGFWTTDPTMVGLIRAALDGVTGVDES